MLHSSYPFPLGKYDNKIQDEEMKKKEEYKVKSDRQYFRRRQTDHV